MFQSNTLALFNAKDNAKRNAICHHVVMVKYNKLSKHPITLLVREHFLEKGTGIPVFIEDENTIFLEKMLWPEMLHCWYSLYENEEGIFFNSSISFGIIKSKTMLEYSALLLELNSSVPHAGLYYASHCKRLAAICFATKVTWKDGCTKDQLKALYETASMAKKSFIKDGYIDPIPSYWSLKVA